PTGARAQGYAPGLARERGLRGGAKLRECSQRRWRNAANAATQRARAREACDEMDFVWGRAAGSKSILGAGTRADGSMGWDADIRASCGKRQGTYDNTGAVGQAFSIAVG